MMLETKTFKISARISFAELILLLLCFLSMSSLAQTDKMNKIHLDFGNKRYDRLGLKVTLEGNIKVRFEGKSKNGSSWDFFYPDSLYEQIIFFNVNDENDSDTIVHSIAFTAIVNGDTLRCASCHFNRGTVAIRPVFQQTFIYNSEFYNVALKKSIYRRVYQDAYMITSEADGELLASIEATAQGYSMFAASRNNSGLTYEACVERCIQLVRKYPQSYRLLATLTNTLNYYRTKNDVEGVYNCFSKNIKNTYFGREIRRYLDLSTFKNMQLPIWNTEEAESIILDKKKISLVIFSASWCIPCHKQLPLVWQIKKDLGSVLDITYISIDEANTVAQWKEMMQKGEIPGRSLLSYKQMNTVKKAYFVNVIPFSFLVHPGGKMEVLKISLEKDRSKLYHLLKP